MFLHEIQSNKNLKICLHELDLSFLLWNISIDASSTIKLRPLGLFLPPGNHLPISFVVCLYFVSLQVYNLKFLVVYCHPFFVHVCLFFDNLFHLIMIIYFILYRSPNVLRAIKSRRLRWAGHVARMEEGRSAFKILTGKPTGKIPLGRPKRR